MAHSVVLSRAQAAAIPPSAAGEVVACLAECWMITVCAWCEVTESCSSPPGPWTLTRETCYASICLSE